MFVILAGSGALLSAYAQALDCVDLYARESGVRGVVPPGEFPVSAEEVLAIVPPLEASSRRIIDEIQAQIDTLRSVGADKSEIVALSDEVVERFQGRLKLAGIESRIVELPMEGGLKRKAIQVTGGRGTLGLIGKKMNSSASDSIYRDNVLLYDPYLIFNHELKLAAYVMPQPGRIPGIRLSHDSMVAPHGLANEALGHEIGHMVENVMRDKGIDNGLVGFVVPAGKEKIPIKHYESGFTLGENRQYLTSATQTRKELRRQKDILEDPNSRPELRENARAVIAKANLLLRRRLEQQREFMKVSRESLRAAVRASLEVTEVRAMHWVSRDYPIKMKDHSVVHIPLEGASGAVESYFVAFVPNSVLGNGNLLREAIRNSLKRTHQKLNGIETTVKSLEAEFPALR